MWSVIRSVSGLGKVKSSLLPALDDLNEYFAEVVSDNSASHIVPLGPPHEHHFTVFEEVSVEVVQSYLGRLKVDKAPGSDGIMSGLLRSCARELAPSVAQLINESFNCSTVPSDSRRQTSHHCSNRQSWMPQPLGLTGVFRFCLLSLS